MMIFLPDQNGRMVEYRQAGIPVASAKLGANPARVVYSAAHVVADPSTANEPAGRASIDKAKTMKFRRYLAGVDLSIAEAMDTAQRGTGLDWQGALDLIRRTKAELPDALVANGCGADHLPPGEYCLGQVKAAYLAQVEETQALDGLIILIASRALVKAAMGQEDLIQVYSDVLAACDHPVIRHWLSEMFDPALAGCWDSAAFEQTVETALSVINANIAKVDGIKISFLDRGKKIQMRRRLPAGVKMYTGGDFNYPELIEGDAKGYSHALLGIFDPPAQATAYAVTKLGEGDAKSFRATPDPTVPLARLRFRAPTQIYKTGVMILAWFKGFQDQSIMLNGAQASRSRPYFAEVFRLAGGCGLLRGPDLAVQRLKTRLGVCGA